jgi:putative Ca2+/H+ antiporter (TMEM165/GDT1 family)
MSFGDLSGLRRGVMTSSTGVTRATERAMIPRGMDRPRGCSRIQSRILKLSKLDEVCMDWRVMLSTFAAIFLAEIGDKTQLATLSFASGSSSRLSVFVGSALALVATSAIAVVAGDALARAIPPMWIRRAAGVLFIVIGVLFLFGTTTSDDGAAAPSSTSKGNAA